VYRTWAMRRAGLEMETTTTGGSGGSRVTLNQLAAACELGLASVPDNRERVVNRGGWGHSDGSSWEVKTDASCGFEICTPAFRLNEQGQYPQLREILREIKLSPNPGVNNSCGLHVHVEANDMDWQAVQRLLRLWVRYEPFFFELIPRRRSANTFCPPLRGGRGRWDSTPDSSVAAAMVARTSATFRQYVSNRGRYSSLNLHPWWRSQRVEFRLHSGSLDYHKIRAWTMLMVSLVQRVMEPDMPNIDPPSTYTAQPMSTSYVLKSLGLLPSSIRQDVPQEAVELAAWVNARRLQFGVDRPPPPPPVERTGGFSYSYGRTGCAAGTPMPCPHPRREGYILCSAHYEDLSSGNTGYRIGV
jgi:hypothetical protein